MYKLVKDPSQVEKRESMYKIQEGFITRSENLLRQHQQRSHIHDGLKNLSNQEVIEKITESPNKLKHRAKNLLNFLRKNDIRLTFDGEVDYDHLLSKAKSGKDRRDRHKIMHVLKKKE